MAEALTKRGFVWISRNERTPFAEIDLIFLKADTYYLVEVKGLNSLDFGRARVGAGQRRRLLRARLWFESQVKNHLVALAFAYVFPSQEILLCNELGEAID